MKRTFAGIAGAAMLVSTAQAQNPLVPENSTVQVSTHTWVIPDQGIGGVPNVGIVAGENATLVIDPGLGRRNGETVLREARKVSKNTKLYLATTHYHPEHTTGYVAFPQSTVYINSRVQEAEFAERGLPAIERFSGRSEPMRELLSDAGRRQADVTFDNEYHLDLGGVTVRFLLVGPAHTRGDTAFFVEGDGVLFSGDVVLNNSFPSASADSSVKAWLAAFDSFGALRPGTVVPSHGTMGDGSMIGQHRLAVEFVRDRTAALKRHGTSADDAAGMIQRELQEIHPQWPRAGNIINLAKSAWRETE